MVDTIRVSLSMTYVVLVPKKPLKSSRKEVTYSCVVTPHIPCAKAGALPSRHGGTHLVTRWFHPGLQKEEHLQGGGGVFFIFYFW